MHTPAGRGCRRCSLSDMSVSDLSVFFNGAVEPHDVVREEFYTFFGWIGGMKIEGKICP